MFNLGAFFVVPTVLFRVLFVFVILSHERRQPVHVTAPQSPWQNAYVERLIGSIRRECLDHVIVLNETGLRHILKSYFDYYERSRTHLSLAKDAPVSRPIQPSGMGRIVEGPQVGGLHHRYERIAA